MLAYNSQAGAISPLVSLLEHDPDDVTAELGAVVLRNLALQSEVNRQAIRVAGGLGPLLRLLSTGQARLVYPMRCEVGPAGGLDISLLAQASYKADKQGRAVGHEPCTNARRDSCSHNVDLRTRT